MTSPSKSTKVHGILIAAGASRRLGQPKQLVKFNGRPLINHTIDVLINSDLNNLKIVLGCQADAIAPLIKSTSDIVINEDWESGMGSSISCGVSSVDAPTDGVLISLVDQYYMTSDLIDLLIKEFEKESNNLIVSRYSNEVFGPPVIFPKRLINNLRNLKGDRGAGKLIKSELATNPSQVIIVDFKNGHLDIDTPEDLLNLSQ